VLTLRSGYACVGEQALLSDRQYVPTTAGRGATKGTTFPIRRPKFERCLFPSSQIRAR